jgi:hypothetical protein
MKLHRYPFGGRTRAIGLTFMHVFDHGKDRYGWEIRVGYWWGHFALYF